MTVQKAISTFLLFLLFTLSNNLLFACSMYKVTANGKTMVGNNQDAWRTTTCIWFENARILGEYGCSFTGSRKVGPDRFVPQSGMNEHGLSFSRLTSYYPKQDIDQSAKLQITSETDYLSDILRKCKDIAEAKAFISGYDHSVFIDDVFIYIDRSGDYLVVEPYQLIEGNDPSYVLANFCPSITSNQNARRQTRYKNGEEYFKTHGLDTSLDFCRMASDTMSVCRSRNGDGTLLTSIWNTSDGLVNLYFYHDYGSTIQYNVEDELAKGDHLISIPELFAPNAEFQRLKDYVTPFNRSGLRTVIALTGGVLLLLSLMFFISFIRKRNTDSFNFIKLLFVVLNVILFGYLFVLATDNNIYYFDAPYQHHGSKLLSLSSYIPVLFLIAFLPITMALTRFLKSNRKRVLIKGSLVFNGFVYLTLMFGFGYWGLYDVFG